MALTFDFFSDPALTEPITSFVQFVQNVSSPVAADKVVYFGSPAAGHQAQSSTNPGVDAITVSVVDGSGGTETPITDFKLALTSGGLASAVGGAALSIGTTVLSGAANAVQIHIRVLDSRHVAGVFDALTIAASPIGEWA